MPSYLAFRAARHRLLIDVRYIREVIPADRLVAAGRNWRGKPVPALDLSRLLGGGGDGGRGGLVVEGADGGALILEVDEIGKIHHLDRRAFRPLPPLPRAAAALFDGLLVGGGGGTGMLRLRRRALDAGLSRERREGE